MAKITSILYLAELVAVVCVPATFSAESVTGLTQHSLEENYFKSIRAEKGNLVLQLKDSGGRFLYQRGAQEPTLGAYGELITVSASEPAALISRHGSLRFTPLPKPLDGCGFFVQKTFDARSFGGNVERRSAIILVSAQGALRFVEAPLGFDPARPLSADLQQQMNKLIEESTSLSSHSLYAETPRGKAAPPFPNATTKIVLEWKLRADAANEPMESRWIAVDTGGVAPKNHVIASNQSEPGKREGRFTLSRPTQGFPAGRYRLEIWQGGKIVHASDFEVRKPD